MFTESLLLAYFGPDTMLPVTSAITAIAGAVMMFWRLGLMGLVRRWARFGKPATSEPVVPRPHFGNWQATDTSPVSAAQESAADPGASA